MAWQHHLCHINTVLCLLYHCSSLIVVLYLLYHYNTPLWHDSTISVIVRLYCCLLYHCSTLVVVLYSLYHYNTLLWHDSTISVTLILYCVYYTIAVLSLLYSIYYTIAVLLLLSIIPLRFSHCATAAPFLSNHSIMVPVRPFIPLKYCLKPSVLCHGITVLSLSYHSGTLCHTTAVLYHTTKYSLLY